MDLTSLNPYHALALGQEKGDVEKGEESWRRLVSSSQIPFFFFGDSSHGVISGRPRRNLQVSDVLVGHEWIIVDS